MFLGGSKQRKTLVSCVRWTATEETTALKQLALMQLEGRQEATASLPPSLPLPLFLASARWPAARILDMILVKLAQQLTGRRRSSQSLIQRRVQPRHWMPLPAPQREIYLADMWPSTTRTSGHARAGGFKPLF